MAIVLFCLFETALSFLNVDSLLVSTQDHAPYNAIYFNHDIYCTVREVLKLCFFGEKSVLQ